MQCEMTPANIWCSCDTEGCSQKHTMDIDEKTIQSVGFNKISSADYIKNRFRMIGWTFFDGKDYCPDCSKRY